MMFKASGVLNVPCKTSHWRFRAPCPDHIRPYLGISISYLLFIIYYFFSSPAFADSKLSGAVTHVRDGDTIEVLSVPIRLQGLHAPELGTVAGDEASSFMRDLLKGQVVDCSLSGHKSYDRQIGVCWLNGHDLAEIIIGAGLARDCPRYSKGRYKKFETDTVKNWPLPKYCN
ncbi:thermonuclease family protein [Kiloniella laminariae]|uniref:Thermonuclease family protein n=1 Tax=Kiloniella laminariae TaxID=454162 RepID=A0ABT4LPY1_9PROT|nr:thermonuclease family protein [Kiloniella laminariae]MCZ4283142.1 thermonuclease family protein [Kiloniella laminariae]